MPRKLDGSGYVFCRGWRELQKFAARPFEREAMLVLSARRIWPQRGNADAVFAFDCLRIPNARRAVHFRRHPPLDVPAIHRWILRFLAQLDDFAEQRSRRGIALLEFSADPREAVPSPNSPVIRFTETVDSAGAF